MSGSSIAAKNRAIDILRRDAKSIRFTEPEESSLPDPEASLQERLEAEWDEKVIKDDMLRMMFACCHPGIPEENQVTLILKTLCGFSTAEIARAFVASEDTISKRLYRTKQFFRQKKIAFDVPPAGELKERTDAVLNSIYLLFNEGYNSTDSEELVREDLMEEAMLRVHGPTEALTTINAIPDRKRLEGYYLYHSLLGEIYSRLARTDEADREFETASALTKSEIEKRLLSTKISGNGSRHT